MTDATTHHAARAGAGRRGGAAGAGACLRRGGGRGLAERLRQRRPGELATTVPTATPSAAGNAGHRVAAPRAPRTPRRRPRSASSAARARRSPTSRSSARAAARMRASSRPTRPGTGESFLPAQPFSAGEHVTRQRAVDGGGASVNGAHELHHRRPGSGQPGGVPAQAGRPAPTSSTTSRRRRSRPRP